MFEIDQIYQKMAPKPLVCMQRNRSFFFIYFEAFFSESVACTSSVILASESGSELIRRANWQGSSTKSQKKTKIPVFYRQLH